jgi:hypothetical protein
VALVRTDVSEERNKTVPTYCSYRSQIPYFSFLPVKSSFSTLHTYRPDKLEPSAVLPHISYVNKGKISLVRSVETQQHRRKEVDINGAEKHGSLIWELSSAVQTQRAIDCAWKRPPYKLRTNGTPYNQHLSFLICGPGTTTAVA